MKHLLLTLFFAIAFVGCSMNELVDSELGEAAGIGSSEGKLSSAVKETLEISSLRASDVLSESGGYYDNPALKIMMPEQFNKVTSALKKAGLGSYVENIEKKMNDGAEQAAAKAGDLFVASIKQMDVNDAMGIVRGGDDAATQYFRGETEDELREEYQPIIHENLEKVGFYNEYRSLLDAYEKLPLTSKVNLDIEDHVVEQSLDGLFKQVADEEKSIRSNPLGRGSELINSMFKSKN